MNDDLCSGISELSDVSELKEQLVESFFCLKHLIANLHVETDEGEEKSCLSIAELALMKDIQENAPDSDHNAGIADIKNHLYISKAGVSKMLGVLEKKGYVNRDVDKNNRRNLIITLTEKGKNAVSSHYKKYDELLIQIIQQLGEDDTKKFVKYVNKFSDVMKKYI